MRNAGLKIIILLLFWGILVIPSRGDTDSNWVYTDGNKLFQIHQPFQNISPARRAMIANTKLAKIIQDPHQPLDQLILEVTDSFHTIIIGPAKVLTIGDADTLGTGLTSEQIARDWHNKIREGVLAARGKYTSWQTWSKMIMAVLLPFIFIIVIWLLHLVFKKASRKLVNMEGGKIKGVRFKEKILISGKNMVIFIIKALRVVKWILYLITFYTFLIIFFNIFSPTKTYTQTLIQLTGGLIRDIGNFLLDFSKPFLGAILLLLIGRYLFKLVNYLFHRVKDNQIEVEQVPPELLTPLRRLIKGIIAFLIIIGILLLIPGFEGPFACTFFGLLVAFFLLIAARPTMSILACFTLLLLEEIKLNDIIEFEGMKGKIVGVNILFIRLELRDPEITADMNQETRTTHSILIPNYRLLKGAFSRKRTEVIDVISKNERNS
ncbi:mechanosensitive ion channel [bacterium]|nr:mechanosensitive ion channel [bacterium]